MEDTTRMTAVKASSPLETGIRINLEDAVSTHARIPRILTTDLLRSDNPSTWRLGSLGSLQLRDEGSAGQRDSLADAFCAFDVDQRTTLGIVDRRERMDGRTQLFGPRGEYTEKIASEDPDAG